MKAAPLIAVAALAASLSACMEDDPVGADCDDFTNTQSARNGDTITLSTGLRYIETSVGAGLAARSCNGVAVSYVGMLTNGTRFDSASFQFTPGLGELIPGFEQGVVGMQVGGRRRVIIPPALGYGAEARYNQQGQLVIPGNSTLVFDLTLNGVQQ
ncbi:MAG TPA: FKBP-type peptidyl-prolyl cis-trans isomerase [Longimicrobiaceae bacterium]